MKDKMKKGAADNTFRGYLEAKLKNKTFREAFEHYHDALKIGLQIRDLRETAGLTQKMLAERLGVSQQVIARLESGDADNPTVTTLDRIAKATGHRLRFRFERTRTRRVKVPTGRGGALKARAGTRKRA